MEIKNHVRKWFYESIEKHPTASSELKNAIKKRHPRVEGYLTKLAWEITQAQAHRLKSGKPAFKEATLKSTVQDMTNLFIIGIETEATRRIESDLTRLQREQEAQKIKDMESTLAGKPAGAFEEMGIVTNEGIDQEREESLEG